MRRSRCFVVFLVILGSIAGITPAHAVSTKQLPPYYRKWIEEDAVYIINQEEKAEYLKLKTDAERDKFIAEFWESRNPDPHSTINTFKEEHYRRMAYVRATYGDSRYDDGWRTDMGRVYITLGPPKQLARYHIGMNTREVEIWFYQATSPALPAYFNIVFFKRGAGEEYQLYSPRLDGPQRIVTDDMHSDAAALKTIGDAMGSEAEHAMVSLLPGEPIDVNDPRPTMDSDFLLAAVRNLPDQKLEKERIQSLRAAAKEKVTTSIFSTQNATDIETAVLRDDQGRESLHFLLRDEHVNPRLVGTLPDQKSGYQLTMITRVSTEAGKAVYQQRDELIGTVSDAGAKAAKTKLFGVEGRLPLVPGDYEMEATLTNDLTHEATRTRKKIVVPAANPTGLGMSDLIAYRSPSPVPDADGQLPFSVSKLRFTPRGPQSIVISAGEKLPLMYQIWFPAADVQEWTKEAAKPEYARNIKRVHVHYLLGTVSAGAGATPTEEDEEVEVKNLDAAGNLLTGRTLDTSHLEPGTYRLVAKVTEPGSPRSAFATMTVRVVPAESNPGMWTAFGDEKAHPAWQDDILRGIAAEALGNTLEAQACYRRALAANPEAVDAQNHLDALTKKVAVKSPGPQ